MLSSERTFLRLRITYFIFKKSLGNHLIIWSFLLVALHYFKLFFTVFENIQNKVCNCSSLFPNGEIQVFANFNNLESVWRRFPSSEKNILVIIASFSSVFLNFSWSVEILCKAFSLWKPFFTFFEKVYQSVLPLQAFWSLILTCAQMNNF